MPKRGRPTKYTEDLPKKLPALFEEGQSVVEVCAELGIEKDAFYAWCKKYPEFSSAYKKGLALSQAWWEKVGRAGAVGKLTIQPATWIFNMKNRFKWGNLPGNVDNEAESSWREAQDFLTFRLIKGCFGTQTHYVACRARLVAAMAGRRAGKTEGNIRAVVIGLLEPGAIGLILCLTYATSISLYWNHIEKVLAEIGATVEQKNRAEGEIRLANGSVLFFRGNSSTDEREKLRGHSYDIVVIDEAQSQKALGYLIDDILTPATVDRKGQIRVTGTGPRVRGTYWEILFGKLAPVAKFNWNLLENPYIDDGETELARIRADKGLLETSPLYVREYLGQIAYDDDALVYRLGSSNYFTEAELEAWKLTVPPCDLHCSIGLDWGFTDADAIAVILWADYKAEKWIIHEYKARRENTEQLAAAARVAIEVANRHTQDEGRVAIYVDSSAAKGRADLETIYKLPVQQALPMEKRLAVENLQGDVRAGKLKVREGGIFDDEALKVVFARDAGDNLTREIDDETYHPDLIMAALYADRPISIYARRAE